MFTNTAYAVVSTAHVQVDSTLYNAMIWIILAFASSLLALGVKYIWSLIQLKNNPPPLKQCPWHDLMASQVQNLKEAVRGINECIGAIKIRYVDKDDYKDFAHTINASINEIHGRITDMEKSFLTEVGAIKVAISELRPK